jgi:hypothetical protein
MGVKDVPFLNGPHTDCGDTMYKLRFDGMIEKKVMVGNH